jgi:galactonate dehydratase
MTGGYERVASDSTVRPINTRSTPFRSATLARRWAVVVARTSPQGQLDRVVRVAVSQATACCFGGPDRPTLLVTSGHFVLTSQRLNAEPLAGGVFAFRWMPQDSNYHLLRDVHAMKITAIKSLVCNARMRNWVFVKVETDQPGLVGWGEATLEWHTRAIVGAIEDISTLLIGEDPRRIEHLWQMMFRQHFWHSSGIVRSTAMSGIDIALWDMAGKLHNVPCHQLWGGPVRDYIRLYCHLGGGRMEDFYQTPIADGDRFADLARGAVDEGYTAFKSMAVPPTAALEGIGPVRDAEQVVARIREAVGPDVDIMVDCHARPSPAMGLQFAKALEPYRLYFLEEPCWPETVESLSRINAAVSTPIATGERLTHLAQFRDLFAVRGCEVAQPDITHCGGLSAARKIAALAEAHRIALAPHNPQGPISTAASFEFGFSQPDYMICETVSEDVAWRSEVAHDHHTLNRKGRTVTPSSKPGLGVELDEGAIARHPFEQEVAQRVFYPDGSVGDW